MRATTKIRMLRTAELKVSTLNPRRGAGNVDELAASIRKVGLLQPLLVTPNGKGYLVLAGQRRLAAARKIRMREVPCIVRRLGERDREVAMLVENVQRVPLSHVEEAAVYVRLIQIHGLKQYEVAEVCGVSEFKVSTHLALLRLPTDVIQRVDRGEVPLYEALQLGEYRKNNPAPVGKQRGVAVSLHTLKGHERCRGTCEVRAHAKRRGRV